MSEPYDSTIDTIAHIRRVGQLLSVVLDELEKRSLAHDASKLRDPEKSAFDVLTPRLKGLTYGSDEYRECLREMKPEIDHHYAENSHHPEHYPNGIGDMSLLDVIEMLADWKAAGERHANGSMAASLEHNKGRFGIDDQLFSILENTVKELGW